MLLPNYPISQVGALDAPLLSPGAVQPPTQLALPPLVQFRLRQPQEQSRRDRLRKDASLPKYEPPSLGPWDPQLTEHTATKEHGRPQCCCCKQFDNKERPNSVRPLCLARTEKAAENVKRFYPPGLLSSILEFVRD